MTEIDCNRLEKILIFVLGTLDELCLKGYVERDLGTATLSSDGVGIFRALKQSGFKCSPDEIAAAIELFRRIPE